MASHATERLAKRGAKKKKRPTRTHFLLNALYFIVL